MQVNKANGEKVKPKGIKPWKIKQVLTVDTKYQI